MTMANADALPCKSKDEPYNLENDAATKSVIYKRRPLQEGYATCAI
jgi:hypothetical protein